MKQTAGTLLYRHTDQGLQVLLVHPSGNYNRKSPWSIPKGLPEQDEPLEQAARRETFEEAGIQPGTLFPLGHVDYTKSKKRVHCFAGPAPGGAQPICASWEVDRSEFIPISQARRIIHPDQAPFLTRLQNALRSEE